MIYYARFNVDGLLRGNYASRMQGYATGISNGFLCVNDVRRLENMDLVPDSEGGNLFLCNGSMTPLRMAGAAYKNGSSQEQSDPNQNGSEQEPDDPEQESEQESQEDTQNGKSHRRERRMR